MTLNPETILNKRYRIISILGHGGMSSVYQALDENIGVPVAVKENLVLTDNYSRQFQREASVLATLRHPNLPRVSDYFFIPGQGQYLVMDFIEGEDLRERIERLDQLPEREVMLIGAAICDALLYLHQRIPPVIHRDIKPGNIKITPEGHIVLVDFGLVKLLEGNQQTATGARAMTPGYSPPEQYGTGHTDERSDIYSIGATLYAALTGIIPEDGLSRLTGKEKLTPIKSKRSNISNKFAAVIEKSLEINVEKRYQNAQDLRMAILDAGNMATIPKESSLVSPPPLKKADLPIIQTGISQPIISGPISIPVSNYKNKSNLYWIFGVITLFLSAIIIWQFGFNGNSNLFNSKNNETIPTTTIQSLPGVIPTSDLIISTEPPQPQKTETSSVLVGTQTNQLVITPTGGGGGLIAYSSNQESNVMQLWLMQVDGSKARQITFLEDGACQPTWSPDGQKLAFISPCANKSEIYEGSKIFIYDFKNDGEILPLPLPADPSGDFDPSWSPDGSKIAFSSLRPGNDPETKERQIHIYIYDFKDGILDEITDTRRKDRHPAWSPDSKKLAFVRKIATTEIWWVDTNGLAPDRFSGATTKFYNYPTWSKDGKIIFYTEQSSEGGLPYFSGKRITDAGLPLEFKIPPAGNADIIPAAELDISPDGAWFIFEHWPEGTNHDLYIASINGANLTKINNKPSFEFGAKWQPGNSLP
jgi:serine/threonine protein kinase